MNEQQLRDDTQARERALALASFIVEAPAGAGKTELLTQRYLRLLATVRHPEEVVALTFTNKAATEMRDRILGSLERAAEGHRDHLPEHKQITFDLAQAVLARDGELAWGLLRHPGRLRITTLDALCATLARQMPYLSRFGAQPGVAEDATPHYRDAARKTLEMVEGDGPGGETVAAALAFMDNDAVRLERLIVSLLARRDQWLHHAGRLQQADLREEVRNGLTALIERDLAELAACITPALQIPLMAPLRFAAANQPERLAALLDWQTPLGATTDDLPGWRTLASALLTGKGEFRQRLTVKEGFPAGAEAKPFKDALAEGMAHLAATPDAAALLARAPTLPPPDLDDFEWSTVTIFARLLQLAAGQLWLTFREAGEVDFTEIAARASLALGDEEAPTDLAEALDYRIAHLLVDEFQDTSPTQVALLEKLTRGWTPNDGRTLFLVGDPMQSIYRFRKADVGLFLRVRERGIGDIALENLRLYRNNRSHPAIVEWVNHTFPNVFPANDVPERGAVRYQPSAATRPARDDSGVTVHALLASSRDDAAQQAEASKVLEIIRSTRAATPDADIAVLVRARSHLDALIASIRRDAPELAFQAIDIEGLADRQHIQDLLILSHALLHRADRIHWLALLRAPWCGLTLADLHCLAGDERHATIWQLMQDEARVNRLSGDGAQRLRHVRAILAEALAHQGRQAPRRWLQGVWLMLGGPLTLESPAAMADVDAFFRLVDDLAASKRLTPEMLEQKAAELYAPPDPLAGAALQLMTIHKSKGLEFDTVILPGLQRLPRANESSLLLWDEIATADAHAQLVVAPIRQRGSEVAEASAYDTLRRLEAERSAHEAERLLYVGATRAIRQLHLVTTFIADDEREEGVKAPPASSLAGLLWPHALASAVDSASAAPVAAGGTVPASIDPAQFVPDLVRLAHPAPLAPFSAAPPLPAQNPPDNEEASGNAEARIGTLVHRCLELVVKEGLAAWTTERVTRLEPAYRRWLRQQGLDAAAAQDGATLAVLALQRTLNSDIGRWILAPHTQGAAEQAWSSQKDENGGIVAVNHVIDRIFIADGIRWIIDYKTVQFPETASPETLRARAETYRPQLERYAALFADDPLPCRMAIFFPLQTVLETIV